MIYGDVLYEKTADSVLDPGKYARGLSGLLQESRGSVLDTEKVRDLGMGKNNPGLRRAMYLYSSLKKIEHFELAKAPPLLYIS